jgi:hypothetical protein
MSSGDIIFRERPWTRFGACHAVKELPDGRTGILAPELNDRDPFISQKQILAMENGDYPSRHKPRLYDPHRTLSPASRCAEKIAKVVKI